MKNTINILLFSFCVAAIFSCQRPPLPIAQEKINNTDTTDTTGNGGTGEQQPNAYVGTWNYTEIELKNGKLKSNGQDFGTFTGVGTKIVGQVVISEKPNTYTTELQFTADVSAVVFGQTRDEEVPVDKTTSSGTWTETGGVITLTDDSGTDLGILSSTSSKIVFTGNFSEKIPLNQVFVLDANGDAEFTIEK